MLFYIMQIQINISQQYSFMCKKPKLINGYKQKSGFDFGEKKKKRNKICPHPDARTKLS